MVFRLKNLFTYNKKSGGRNNRGKITFYHRGGGHKRLYRIIGNLKNEYIYNVCSIEYDPNRSAYISLVYTIINNKKNFVYILSPDGLKIGDTLFKSMHFHKDINAWHKGCCLKLKYLPIGLHIYNIESLAGGGALYTRSAGSKSRFIDKNLMTNKGSVKLASGKVIKISLDCTACIGIIGNANYKNIKLRKAGQSRWLGKRPVVRGVAMNPIDHPHGGGEGKTSGGRHSSTPWGKLTKGPKTRNVKN